MHWRNEILGALRDGPEVSVLILGGGINGVGLLRELSLQGVDCLLVDKSDFAAGATSKSSRMIHGGLRYLENGEFRLVRESLHERNRLLKNAPHFVSPLRTTIPLFSWLGGLLRSPLIFAGVPVKPGSRGALIVKLGLSFYDFFTRGNRRTPRHYLSSRRAAIEEVPGLHPEIVAAATYWDACITQAERLCLELIQDAQADCPSCRALNYVSLEGRSGDVVTLRDQVSGQTVSVKPSVIVNATGAWVDRTNAALGLPTRLIGGTKGSHLVVENEALLRAVEDRMVYYQTADGRVCIVFAMLGKVIMGSTDIREDDPDGARCDEEETAYMLETLRGVFPSVEISRSEIVYKFCGVRPLPATGDDVPGKISRDHSIRVLEPTDETGPPVFCLVGGKWTTFRGFAEQTADALLARLGRERRRPSTEIAIGGGRDYPPDDTAKLRWVERVSKETGLSGERIERLLERYGTRAEDYAKGANPDAETPLGSLPHYTRGEIEHIVANESVVHLTDLICRRSVIALVGEARPDALEELAAIAGDAIGWDAETRAREVEAAAREVAV